MQRNIEVVLSPLLLPLVELSGKTVVVIDILRATSTICAILNNGARSVIPVVTTDEALALKSDQHLVAGERNGQKAEGFDFGNSPVEYSNEVVNNKHVVLTTTNGTKCIHASMDAAEILVGSFYNIDVLCNYLRSIDRDVVMFCSGWKNRVNIEDTLFAGYVVDALRNSHTWLSDEVELALDLVERSKSNPIDYLRKASHAQRFERLGNTEDLERCMQFNQHPVVPRYENGQLICI